MVLNFGSDKIIETILFLSKKKVFLGFGSKNFNNFFLNLTPVHDRICTVVSED